MTNKHVSVIVLGYNSDPYLEQGCLESVICHSHCDGYQVKVIFLDNGSSDNTRTTVRRKYQQVDLLTTLHNTWYCRGNNIAMQYAYHRYGSHYFVLVDHDYIVEKSYLAELTHFMDAHVEAGTCQSLTRRLDQPQLIYSAGHRYETDGSCFPVCEWPETTASYVEVPSCSIAASIFRVAALEKVGLLDPIFEIYYESSDISFRLRTAGYKCFCNLNAVAYQEGHIHKGFMHRTWYFTRRNKIIFWAKHDQRVYEKLRQDYLSQLREAARTEKFQSFLVDEVQETLRRAYQDGLRLAKKRLPTNRWREVRVQDWDKHSVVVLGDDKS